MYLNVLVLYCSIKNDPKFPGINNNNHLFYSEICFLVKVHWKQIMLVSKSVTQGSSAANWDHRKTGLLIFVSLMLVLSWDLSWSCLSEHLHMTAWYPHRMLAGFQVQVFYNTRWKLFISFLFLCNKLAQN